MPRKPENRGACAYCGEVITKRGVTKHLEKCSQRLEVLHAAGTSSRSTERLWHLHVHDAHDKDYWLNLEMRGSAPLAELDDYLRSIWLECCGHLSMFTIGGWHGDKIADFQKADAVFKPGLVLRHLYDFGTTSETDVRIVNFRKGEATTHHPIALLARNLIPAAFCQECGLTASWLCMECVYEDDNPGLLCDEHGKDHPHVDYGGPTELVNSPRLGMCGYDGLAEPPY